MVLYKAKVIWYSADADDDSLSDTVFGFADNFSDFARRIEASFPEVETMEIKVVNPMACETELLFVDSHEEEIEFTNSY